MNLKEYYKNRLNSLLEGGSTNPLQLDPIPSHDDYATNEWTPVSPFQRALKTDKLVGTSQFDPITNFRNAFARKANQYNERQSRTNDFVKSQQTVAEPAPGIYSDVTRHEDRQKQLDKDTDDFNAYQNSRAKKEIESNRPKTGKMNPAFNPGV